MESFHYTIIIVITTFLSAGFTTVEIAMFSNWRMQLEIDKSSGIVLSKLKKWLKSNPDKFAAAIFTGNLVTFILCVLAFANLLSPVFQNYFQSKLIEIILITFVSAIVFLIFGKLIPKTVFPFVPNKVINVTIILVSFILFLLYPFASLILLISKGFYKQNTSNTEKSSPIFNRIETNWVIQKNDFNQ